MKDALDRLMINDVCPAPWWILADEILKRVPLCVADRAADRLPMSAAELTGSEGGLRILGRILEEIADIEFQFCRACTWCRRMLLWQEVAAAASMPEEGSYGIVLTIEGLLPDAEPAAVASFVLPRVIEALAWLSERYHAAEARVTIEQSVDGVANLHVIQRGSRPKKDTLRDAFGDAGLGRRIEVEPVRRMLALACYPSKIPLWSLLAPDARAAQVVLDYCDELYGGTALALRTANYLGPEGSYEELVTRSSQMMKRVGEWVVRYAGFLSKMPPQLLARIRDAGYRPWPEV